MAIFLKTMPKSKYYQQTSKILEMNSIVLSDTYINYYTEQS